jgi:hypothetical protein
MMPQEKAVESSPHGGHKRKGQIFRKRHDHKILRYNCYYSIEVRLGKLGIDDLAKLKRAANETFEKRQLR